MAKHLKSLVVLVLGVLMTSCLQAPSAGTAKLVLLLPKNISSSSSSSNMGTMSALPTDGKLCFAVNIKGPGLPLKDEACSPKLGMVAGFYSADEKAEIEMKIPYGSDREIEVFLYKALASEACPKLGPTGESASQIDDKKVYRVGYVSGLVFDKPTVDVSITLDYPGDANNIVKTLNYPANCGGYEPLSSYPFEGRILSSPTTTQEDTTSGNTFEVNLNLQKTQ